MASTRHESARYGRDETADIFDLAAEVQAREGGDELDLSRSDIYRIAEELGISRSSIDEAIRQMAKADRRDSKESRKSVKRRMRFIRHAMAYVITVSILALVDALGGGGWWFFYVAAIWGIILALHAMRFVTRRNGPLERRLAGG